MNDITLDHFPTCTAYLIKDATSNLANQSVCPHKAKVIFQGSLTGSLFNKGTGDTVVGLCKTHANVASRKRINVYLSTTDLNNKENTMNHNRIEAKCVACNKTREIEASTGLCDTCTIQSFEEAQEERDYQHVSGKYENPVFTKENTMSTQQVLALLDEDIEEDGIDHTVEVTAVQAITPEAPKPFILGIIGGREIAKDADAEAKLVDNMVGLLSRTMAAHPEGVAALIGGAEGMEYVAARACHALKIRFSVVLPNDRYGFYYWGSREVKNGKVLRAGSIRGTDRTGAFNKMLEAAKNSGGKVLSIGGKDIYKNGHHTNILARAYIIDHASKVWVMGRKEQGMNIVMDLLTKKGKKFFEVSAS